MRLTLYTASFLLNIIPVPNLIFVIISNYFPGCNKQKLIARSTAQSKTGLELNPKSNSHKRMPPQSLPIFLSQRNVTPLLSLKPPQPLLHVCTKISNKKVSKSKIIFLIADSDALWACNGHLCLSGMSNIDNSTHTHTSRRARQANKLGKSFVFFSFSDKL